jgi:hypothetical protein
MNIHDFRDTSASQRTNIINERTYNRNIPSQLLQPYLDSRAVSTKYSIMPIVDPRKKIQVPLEQLATYNPEQTFNPGNDSGPWSGYSSNVNTESELRNQVFAIQHCSQATYIPNSNSSLYNIEWNLPNKTRQPFPGLFQEETFQRFNPNPNPNTIGAGLFNNNTRQQLKDMTPQQSFCN